MKIQTSNERRATIQVTSEPYQHPAAIPGHIYMITNDRGYKEMPYYAVFDKLADKVRLYSLCSGTAWSSTSTFGDSMDHWKDITDKVYLNTDDLEAQQ